MFGWKHLYGSGDIETSVSISATNPAGTTNLGTGSSNLWIRARTRGIFSVTYHGVGVFNYDPHLFEGGGADGNVNPHNFPSTTISY